jgi:Zn-dependent protease with chaperone function
VSAYYHDLALALGGKRAPQDEWCFVIARIGPTDVYIAGSNEGIIYIRLDGLFSEEVKALQNLFEHPQSGEFLKQWGVSAKDSQVIVADGQPVLTFPMPQARLPVAAELQAWLQWVGEQARPFLLIEECACSDCGSESGEIVALPCLTGRYCAACRQENERLYSALAELPAEEEEPDAPTLDFYDAFDADWLARKAHHYEQKLRLRPRAFALEMLAWVAVGQLALAGGAGLLALLLSLLVGFTVWMVMHGRAAVFWFATPLLKLGVKLAVPIGLIGTGLYQSAVAVLRRPGPKPLPGLRLERSQAPVFFAWLDSIAERMEAPKADLLYLTDDMNAAALEHRQRRGRYQRIVMLGVPVIETFSQSELEIIMAHELGHLSHGDSSGAWIYRTAATWSDIGGQLQGQSGLNLFAVFARWYLPHFLVRAQASSRIRELAADRRAVQGKVPGSGAAELMKFEVLQTLYHQVLAATIHRAALRGELDTFDIVQQPMEAAAREQPHVWRDILQDAVLAPAGWLDTHPSLAQRLENLDFPVEGIYAFRLRVEENCAELFPDYSTLREQVLGTVNRRMRLQARLQAMRFPGLRRRLERLISQDAADPLHSERVFQQACCAQDLEEFSVAEGCLREIADDEKPEVRKNASTKLVSLLLDQQREEEALEIVNLRLEEEPENLHWLLGAWLLRQRRGEWADCWELCCRILQNKDLEPHNQRAFEQRRDQYAKLLDPVGM